MSQARARYPFRCATRAGSRSPCAAPARSWTWDDSLLGAELCALRSEEFDLGLIGFDQVALDRLLADAAAETGTSPATDPDAPAPEPPEVPVTRPRDLWLLGPHRLLCGDATSAAEVGRLLDGARPHLMITDPPYGVEYDPAWRNAAGVSATMRMGKVANDDPADWRAAWALFPDEVAYVWHAAVHARRVIESLEATGSAVRSQIVWAKSRFVLGRGDHHWQREPCLYAVRKGGTGGQAVLAGEGRISSDIGQSRHAHHPP